MRGAMAAETGDVGGAEARRMRGAMATETGVVGGRPVRMRGAMAAETKKARSRGRAGGAIGSEYAFFIG